MNVLGAIPAGASDDVMTLVVIFAAVVAVILCASVIAIIAIRERERSRRELAAYVAEGSMTPEQAAMLMRDLSKAKAEIGAFERGAGANREKAASPA